LAKAGKTGREVSASLGFPLSVSALYFLSALYNPSATVEALLRSLKILANIAPILVVVILLMAFTSYLLSPGRAARYLSGKSGWRGWLLAIIGGIISTGPIYVWYPMLGRLREQGVRPGLLAAFLYNRAVKIPLIPLMMYYFGLPFVLTLTILTILASLLEGVAIELLLGGKG